MTAAETEDRGYWTLPGTSPMQLRRDYERGWKASRDGDDLEPVHSLDAFDAGYADEQAGAPKYLALVESGVVELADVGL